MILRLRDEEAMCLDDTLDDTTTTKVQISVTFTDDAGTEYYATRIIKMKLKKQKIGRND